MRRVPQGARSRSFAASAVVFVRQAFAPPDPRPLEIGGRGGGEAAGAKEVCRAPDERAASGMCDVARVLGVRGGACRRVAAGGKARKRAVKKAAAISSAAVRKPFRYLGVAFRKPAGAEPHTPRKRAAVPSAPSKMASFTAFLSSGLLLTSGAFLACGKDFTFSSY